MRLKRPALPAQVAVIVHVRVAHAHARLDAPPGGEQPLVAVAHADSRKPPLEAVVLHPPAADTARIVESVVRVDTQEMPVERLARPVAELRLHKEMLPFPALTELQRVPNKGEVNGKPWGHLELGAQVETARGVLGKVTL